MQVVIVRTIYWNIFQWDWVDWNIWSDVCFFSGKNCFHCLALLWFLQLSSDSVSYQTTHPAHTALCLQNIKYFLPKLQWFPVTWLGSAWLAHFCSISSAVTCSHHQPLCSAALLIQAIFISGNYWNYNNHEACWPGFASI